MTHRLIRGSELGDVRLRDGVVAEIGPRLAAGGGDEVVEAGGGALLPGLHDHHVHLPALAAALRSVDCGDPAGFVAALRAAPGTDWIRGVGYHESVAGSLDRWALDRLVPDRPVRVQHRSGGLWMVNSAGARRLGLDDSHDGRLWRRDDWLRQQLGEDPIDLRPAAELLNGLGITGVTDATPGLGPVELPGLRVNVLGDRKVLLHDHDLPLFDELVERLAKVPRPVAVHCVTREALVLTLAALEEVGSQPGDRIEHGAVIPPELVVQLRRLGLRVVTQPIFVADRGDAYRAEVDPDDLPHLYPYARLLAAGIPTAPSSDAPYGDPDPWRGIAAARDRELGPDQRVPALTALAGYLSPLDDPGGPPRRVVPGAPADLCLLHVPLAEALAHPSKDLVRRTF